MGLQVPPGVDYEVPVSRVGGRHWIASEGVDTGDRAESGNEDLCRCDQPGPRAHADRNTAADIRIEGGAKFEGKELAQDVVGISEFEEAVLGATFVGERILGSQQRECDRRGVEEVHRGTETGRTG